MCELNGETLSPKFDGINCSWLEGGEKIWKHIPLAICNPFAIQCDKCDIEVVHTPRRNIHSSIHIYIYGESNKERITLLGHAFRQKLKVSNTLSIEGAQSL